MLTVWVLIVFCTSYQGGGFTYTFYDTASCVSAKEKVLANSGVGAFCQETKIPITKGR